jgi:hypothetical protein
MRLRRVPPLNHSDLIAQPSPICHFSICAKYNEEFTQKRNLNQHLISCAWHTRVQPPSNIVAQALGSFAAAALMRMLLRREWREEGIAIDEPRQSTARYRRVPNRHTVHHWSPKAPTLNCTPKRSAATSTFSLFRSLVRLRRGESSCGGEEGMRIILLKFTGF